MTVEFQLLGSVEARIDGHSVDLGTARQRCVLVALLVEVNRVVPVGQLLERVWGGDSPLRARDTLYTYLSRLRATLTGAEDVMIDRRSGGYVVAADPDAVDLHRFRRLVGEVRETDDDEHAATLYEQALGLWRGEAFAALDTPWLNQIRDTLDAERRAAELGRNDLKLRLGQHADLLAELSTSAAEYPLDERLAGQFMLALYRRQRVAHPLAGPHTVADPPPAPSRPTATTDAEQSRAAQQARPIQRVQRP